MRTRRQWIQATVGGGLFLLAAGDSFGASDFWNKKDPSAWTSDEVLRLVTNSPWATTARVLPKPGRDRGRLESGNPDVPSGGGLTGLNEREPGAVPVVPVTEVTVVWESAQPFLDSLKSTFPTDFGNHYVIGVHKLPLQGRNKTNLQNSAATLEARGKAPLDAGVIQPEKDFVLCGFSKELLSLTAADKDVVFSFETDQFSIRTKFEPKNMMYHEKLAV